MKNNKNFDNTNASQARDFWTARLDDCPHERLREALKFQPLHAAPKQVVKTDGQTNPRKGDKSPLQVQLILWKREVIALGRTAYAFLAGFLGFLLSQSQ